MRIIYQNKKELDSDEYVTLYKRMQEDLSGLVSMKELDEFFKSAGAIELRRNDLGDDAYSDIVKRFIDSFSHCENIKKYAILKIKNPFTDSFESMFTEFIYMRKGYSISGILNYDVENGLRNEVTEIGKLNTIGGQLYLYFSLSSVINSLKNDKPIWSGEESYLQFLPGNLDQARLLYEALK